MEEPVLDELLLTRITVDKAPDPVLWIGADARILYGNEAARRRFGYSREELLALRIPDLDPNFPREKEAIARHWREIVARGSRTFETCVRTAEGTLLPVEVTCHHVSHAGGELCVSTVRDLSFSRETEERLRGSEERFREMAELLPEGIFEADLNLAFTYANRRALEIFGLTWEDMENGLRGVDLIAPKDRSRALEIHRRRLQGEEFGAVEYDAVRKDGSVFPVLFHARPIVRDGAPVGIRGVIVDLSEERRTEEEARITGKRVRSLIESSPMGMLFYRLEEGGRLVLTGANPAADRILGVDTSALVGKAIEDAFPGLVATEVPERYREAAARGTPWQTDQIVYDDGRIAGAFEVVAFQTAPGEMAVLFLEISERKRAEGELQRSAERLGLATRSGRIGVWEYEPAADCLEWDDLMYQIYGVERSGAPGGIHRWLQRVHPEDLKAAEESFRQSLEHGRRSFDLEFRILRGDNGSVRHIRGIATCVRDERGRAVRAIGTNRDITESKEAVAALLESEERFRNVIEQSNDAIYILYENRFDLVNRRFCDLTGITPEESKAPDFSFWGLVDPESLPLIRERGERRARGERVPSVYDFVVRRRDGGQVRVEASVTEIDYRGGKAVLGILRDNSEQKRLEEQLRQSQKLESIGRLSGGVAHDLNNLLSPILGYGEMLLEDFGKEDRRREMAEEIVAAAGRARDLIRQLLAFSRKQTLAFRPVELNALITNFQKLLRRTIRENVRLELALTPHLPPVRADLGQLEQVLMNLAVNAEEAMPAGGRLTIETALADLDEDYAATRPGVKPGRYVLLALSDTGVGMDAKTKEMIFEPFFTTKKKGTGLGLATVYGIVKQHGGNIWVYSEPGRGTAFKCYLPALEGEAPRIEKEPEPPAKETPDSGTILVVEDESAVRHLVEAVLRRQGHTVLSAADGKDCLALLAKHEGHLDLVVTDVILPGVNGRDLVEAVRERFPSVGALFMSGYTDEVITKHGVLDEGITFIQKPFSVRQLTARVREALGKR